MDLSSKKIHPNLKKYIPVVMTIAEMFDKKCEVLIHDFRNPQHSIVAIENGHVTGRKIGDPITDLALSVWKKNGYEDKKQTELLITKLNQKMGKY